MPNLEGFDPSKRRFLQIAGSCAAEVVLNPVSGVETVARVAQIGDSYLQTVRSRVDRHLAVVGIESSLGVKFDTIQDNRLWIEKLLDPRKTEVPSHWGFDRIKLGEAALLNLPEHLRRDSQSDEKLHLLLDSKNMCCHDISTIDPVISVDYRSFRVDAPTTAKCILAHEATHWYMKRTDRIAIAQAKSVRDLELIDWGNKVDSILGDNRFYYALDFLDRFSDDLAETDKAITVQKQKGTIEDNHLPKEDEERTRFLAAVIYGFTDEEEFIAATSENYILGKASFMKWYSYYFSPQIAQRLYQFQKNTIFKGFEY